MAKTIFVEVVGNASQFKRELTGAVAATNKANSGFSRMGKAAGIAGLALAGGLALGLEKSVKAAMEAQKSTARLDQAFKNSGLSADTYAKRIEATEKSSRKLGFTDEETRNTLAGLMTATGDVGKSMRDLGIAQDVARLKGVDLSTAAKMVTSTLSGNVRSAKALGIVLLPVTTHMDALRAKYKALGEEIPKAEERTAKFADKQATAAEALQRVTDRTHDQAKAFSETAAGGMAEFHAQTQHLEESLGKGLLPAVTNIVGKLSDLASWFADNPDVAKALVLSLAGLTTAFLVATAAGFILENVLTFGIPLAVIAAAAAIGLIATHLQEIGDWIKSHARLLLVVPILGEMLFLAVEIAKHWTAIKGTVTGAMSAISGAVTSSWHAITGAVSTACGAIQSAVAAMVGVVTGLINKVKAAWDGLRTLAGKAIKFLVEDGALRAVSAVIHAVHSAWDALRSAASTAIEFVTHQSGSGGIRPAPPHRAGGGNVLRGRSYIVGEEGPELFVAPSTGVILPSRSLTGVLHPAMGWKQAGEVQAQALADGFKTKAIGPQIIESLVDTKAQIDNWVDTTATDNLTGKGEALGTAFVGGLRSVLTPTTPAGADFLGGFGKGRAGPAGAAGVGTSQGLYGTGVTVNVAGSVVTQTELTEVIRRELYRIQKRNGTIGFV